MYIALIFLIFTIIGLLFWIYKLKQKLEQVKLNLVKYQDEYSGCKHNLWCTQEFIKKVKCQDKELYNKIQYSFLDDKYK